MKFGISTFVTDEGIRPDVLGAALEERGFDVLFLAEHSHIPVSRETPYPGGGGLPRASTTARSTRSWHSPRRPARRRSCCSVPGSRCCPSAT